MAVDLIGPYGADKLQALTIIDVATRRIEILPIENKESAPIAALVDEQWMGRYQRPEKCIHDQGTEFTGSEFQTLLESKFNNRTIPWFNRRYDPNYTARKKPVDWNLSTHGMSITISLSYSNQSLAMSNCLRMRHATKHKIQRELVINLQLT